MVIEWCVMFVVCDNYYQSYILWNNVVVNVTVIGQVNPCPPELLQLYFSSNCQMTRNLTIYEKWPCPKLNYWIN